MGIKNKFLCLSSLALLPATTFLVWSCSNGASQNGQNTVISNKFTTNELNINISIDSFIKSINKQWIIDNKNKLFRGFDANNLTIDKILELNSNIFNNNNVKINVKLDKSSLIINNKLNQDFVYFEIIISDFSLYEPTSIKPNLNSFELGLISVTGNYNDIISKQWIIDNKDKLFNGTTTFLTNESQIIELNVSDNSNDKTISINLTLEAKSFIDDNAQLTTANKEFNIIISNSIKLETTLVRNNLQASNFDLFASVDSYKDNFITKQWIIDNKQKIFTGTTYYLSKESQITSLNVIINTNEKSMTIDLTLEANSVVDDNNQLNASAKNFNITISNFSSNETDLNLVPTNVISDLYAQTFNLSGTAEYNKQNVITKEWIIENKNKIFVGNTDYLRNTDQISNIIFNISNMRPTRLNATFSLLKGSFVDANNKISTEDKSFTLVIDSFELPKETKVKSTVTVQELGLNGSIGDCWYDLDRVRWFLDNKNKFIEGSLELLGNNVTDIVYNTLFDPNDDANIEIEFKFTTGTFYNAEGKYDLVNSKKTHKVKITGFSKPYTKFKEVSDWYNYVWPATLGITNGTVESNLPNITREMIFKNVLARNITGLYDPYLSSECQIEHFTAIANNLPIPPEMDWIISTPDPEMQLRIDFLISRNCCYVYKDAAMNKEYIQITVIIDFDSW